MRALNWITNFLVLTCILASQSIIGQVSIQINITPDQFPQDVFWSLEDQEYNIIAEGDLKDQLPGNMYTITIDSLEDKCYTFLISDKNDDGISAPGGYEVFYNNQIAVEDYSNGFGTRTFHNINCGIGEVCETAIELKVPSPRRINVPDTKDYWFKFTPRGIDAFYRISMCTNIVLSGPANTALWLYDDCNRFVQTNDAEGALAFSTNTGGDCGHGAEFNYLLLEGGRTYYIRHKPESDWSNTIHNDSLRIKVDSLPLKPGCTDPMACNYDPLAYIENGECAYDPSCLPDLSLDEETLIESIEVDTVASNDACLIAEGCLRGEGPREVVRFTTKIDNIGDADYIVGRPEESPENFSRNNCHGHWHHLGYAEYLLFAGQGQPEPIGFKNGFCVMDLECNEPGLLPNYICAYMGISAGCSDIYGSHIECQWIDITDIEDGTYTMVVRINWNRLPDKRGFQEKEYTNNWGQACINIDRSSGQLIVTVEDDCEEYQDCLGDTFGQATIDCEGVCGGDSQFGDLDNSGKLGYDDVKIYMDMFDNNIDIEGDCFDLNADGEVSIFDAALAYECDLENIAEEGNPFHVHCTLPRGNDRDDQFVSLRSTLDDANQVLELEIRSSDIDVSAYQVEIDGIVIEKVEQLYADTYDELSVGENTVYALHGNDNIDRGLDYVPFLRIEYSEVTSDSICISAGTEFINKDYDRLSLNVESGCHFVSSTKKIFEDSDISILPNPSSNAITITSASAMSEILMKSISGMTISRHKTNGSQATRIDISSMVDGVYLVEVRMKDGSSVIKKIIKN